MKKTMLFGFLCFVFLMAYGYGEQTRPVAVSPGSDSGIVVVSQSCPTFSWSAVQWSNAYKVAVFPAVGAEVLTYEEMELLVSPVVSKEIHGPAFSWTPSEAERLASGEAYVWYVQAVDASGIGVWSEGRLFQVEEEIRFFGIKKKLRESLKEYGMSEEDIERVMTNATAGLPEITVQESSQTAPAYIGVDQGLEGSANTYYGRLAGDTATGSYNSFFGRSAGYQTTGNYNTFVGYFVGRYNQSGNYNTIMGYGAGKWNFFGLNNTYIGAYSGHNSTSSYNTFLGYNSGYSNTSGGYNTMLGTYAGRSNTTGSYNTLIGYNSGYNNTSGGYNTMMGTYSGRSNTTGYYNTFLGYHSGYNSTTANYNTFIGYYAGRYNTTGHSNTYIGRSAGTGISTGSRNVCLGHSAGPTTNQSNFLYINNEQSNTPLIFGNFDVNLLIFYDDSDTWVRIYPDSPANRVIDIHDDAGYGAYCTGTTWVDSSSREVKENIQNLDAEEAVEALDKLEPVKFNYKRDKEEKSVGFIAEDVPDLVATKDRKGMAAMDVVAVLTKVVQEQQKRDDVLTQLVQKQQETIDELRKEINDLKKRK